MNFVKRTLETNIIIYLFVIVIFIKFSILSILKLYLKYSNKSIMFLYFQFVIGLMHMVESNILIKLWIWYQFLKISSTVFIITSGQISPRYFLFCLLLISSMVLQRNLFHRKRIPPTTLFFYSIFYPILLFYYFSVRVCLYVRFNQVKIAIIAAKRIPKICNLQFQHYYLHTEQLSMLL